METAKISLNQLAAFSNSTDAVKNSILKQQLKPNELKMSWYQLPKARIKKSITQKGDLKPIHEAIKILKARKPEGKHQIDDRKVSIEALENYLKIRLPKTLKANDLIIKQPQQKVFQIQGVDIIVAPEIFFELNSDGKTFRGAIKIHISKNKPFDLTQSRYVASCIYFYLKRIHPKDHVAPDLCLCLDIFSGRFTAAPVKVEEMLAKIELLCTEINSLWEHLNDKKS